MSDFVTVAKTDEISVGERMVVEIGRQWIVIFNVDGNYYAIADRCTHDDGPLADGDLYGCEIECPRHSARFDIRTGAVLTPPALVDVPVYAIRVENGDIQVARKPGKS